MSDAISYDARELELLAALEKRHFWFRVRRKIIVDALRRWSPAMRDYLEIGSGTGFVAQGITAAFPDARVTASDPLAPDMLPLDARHMTAEACYDTVGAFDVLEHIGDDIAALRGMMRAVRPGGTVLLTSRSIRHFGARRTAAPAIIAATPAPTCWPNFRQPV